MIVFLKLEFVLQLSSVFTSDKTSSITLNCGNNLTTNSKLYNAFKTIVFF